MHRPTKTSRVLTILVCAALFALAQANPNKPLLTPLWKARNAEYIPESRYLQITKTPPALKPIPNGVLMVIQDKRLRAFDINTGRVKWQSVPGINDASNLENGLVIATLNETSIVAFDRATGRERWRHKNFRRHRPDIHDTSTDYVFVKQLNEPTNNYCVLLDSNGKIVPMTTPERLGYSLCDYGDIVQFGAGLVGVYSWRNGGTLFDLNKKRTYDIGWPLGTYNNIVYTHGLPLGGDVPTANWYAVDITTGLERKGVWDGTALAPRGGGFSIPIVHMTANTVEMYLAGDSSTLLRFPRDESAGAEIFKEESPERLVYAGYGVYVTTRGGRVLGDAVGGKKVLDVVRPDLELWQAKILGSSLLTVARKDPKGQAAFIQAFDLRSGNSLCVVSADSVGDLWGVAGHLIVSSSDEIQVYKTNF